MSLNKRRLSAIRNTDSVSIYTSFYFWFSTCNGFKNGVLKQTWNWCRHKKSVHYLQSQTFGICDCRCNCLWTGPVPFDRIQFWASVHSEPSEIWTGVSSVLWCHCACLRSPEWGSTVLTLLQCEDRRMLHNSHLNRIKQYLEVSRSTVSIKLWPNINSN